MARRFSGRLLAALFAAASAACSEEFWVFDGLASSEVTALAAAPSRPVLWYAGTAAGDVFRLDQEPEPRWAAASAGLPGAPVRALAVHPFDPQRLFAGTDEGIFRSDDGGASWEPSGTGFPGPAVALAIDPLDPAIVWASARSDPGPPLHLYRSVDGGDQWESVTIQGPAFGTPSFSWVVTLAFRPGSSTLFAGWHDVVFFTPGGLQWDLYPDIRSEILAVVPDPFDAALIHVGTQGLGAASTSGSRTPWSFGAGVEGTVVPAIAADPAHPGLFYAVSGDSVFRSLDHGVTWTPVGQPLVSPGALAVSPDGARVRVATAVGVRRLQEGSQPASRGPVDPLPRTQVPTLLEPRQ